jgi:hypothetical protein
MTKIPDEILKLPLHVRAEMALKEAFAEVLAEHKRLGLPVVILRDGKVVRVPAEELESELRRASAAQAAHETLNGDAKTE